MYFLKGKFLNYQPIELHYSSDYSDESTTTEINVAEYDMSLITVPTVIFYSDSDVYVAKEVRHYYDSAYSEYLWTTISFFLEY